MALSKCSFWIILLGALFTVTLKIRERPNSTSISDNEPLVRDKSFVSLGDIGDGEAKIAQINISNRSSNPVTIDGLSATCGCTSATVTAERIPPGGTSILNVELTSQGKRGSFGSRVTVKWTEHRTTNKKQGQLEVVFQATGVYLVTADPGYFDFGAVSNDAQFIEKSFTLIRGTQNIPFEDIRIRSDSEALLIRVVKADVNSWYVVAELFPGKLPSGPMRATLTAAFHNSKNEEVARRKFPVRAEIQGSVLVKPKSIFLGVVPVGNKRQGQIVFEAVNGKKAIINLGTRSVPREPGGNAEPI